MAHTRPVEAGILPRAMSRDMVKAAIDAANREDRDIQVMAPCSELDMSRAAGPGHGIYRLDQTRQFVGEFAASWESGWVEPREFIDAGDLVVMPWTMHAKGRDVGLSEQDAHADSA